MYKSTILMMTKYNRVIHSDIMFLRKSSIMFDIDHLCGCNLQWNVVNVNIRALRPYPNHNKSSWLSGPKLYGSLRSSCTPQHTVIKRFVTLMYKRTPWLDANTNRKSRVVMMPTLWSLAAPEVVVKTNYGNSSDDNLVTWRLSGTALASWNTMYWLQ